jgi:hypothetical protein
MRYTVCRVKPVGNLSNARGLLAQHGADLHELFACEARLASEVGPLVVLLGNV